MTVAPLEIKSCPPQLRTEAISLVLRDLAPSSRLEIAQAESMQGESDLTAFEGLFVGCRDGALRGAAWAQRQPGNTAVFWPPQLASGEDQATAKQLANVATQYLDEAGVAMSQVLLQSPNDPAVPLLDGAGFQHLAKLAYLTCEAIRFPQDPPQMPDLEFLPYDASQHDGFMQLVERTYESTLDCPALNGARRMDDVLEGYQATGKFHAENWLTVRIRGQDAGVLLLADHPEARHWELVYMGLVPEGRGRGLGRQITEYAQFLARRQNVERIVLAVDAANSPALAMYRSAGFEPWDCRTVYVRFSRTI